MALIRKKGKRWFIIGLEQLIYCFERMLRLSNRVGNIRAFYSRIIHLMRRE